MSANSLGLLLKAFRLPTMAQIHERVAQQAEQQGWGYHKFLQHLCEAEAQDRAERKLERLLKQAENSPLLWISWEKHELMLRKFKMN